MNMLLEVKPDASNPHGQRLSVTLNGELINVSALRRATGLDQSYLSKVLLGKIQPTVRNILIIATALDMSVEDLILAIEMRKLA